jgi:hypothetical protein
MKSFFFAKGCLNSLSYLTEKAYKIVISIHVKWATKTTESFNIFQNIIKLRSIAFLQTLVEIGSNTTFKQ